MIKIEEAKIINGLKNKEKESVDQLMITYGHRLMRVCYMIVQDEKLAEDIVQETFIKILSKINQFQGRSSLYTYLYKIAVNECRQKLRKGWFKRVSLFDKWTGPEGRSQGFEEDQLHKLTISQCILKLDLKYREVILLYYYEDMSVAMISEVIKEKEGTIKSRLKRARDLLEDLLKEAGYGE